jgi:dsDNA-specific endonuclease/ATPase MutS2
MARDLLDLHGARVDEVIDRLDRFIMQSVDHKLSRVRVMTGKGSGKVQAEVVRYLKQARYPWQFEKGANGKPNEGVLVVILE